MFQAHDPTTVKHEPTTKSGKINTNNQLELFQAAFTHKDEDAWETIQHLYLPYIGYWLNTLASNQLSAGIREDLTQDTFLRFWQALAEERRMSLDSFPHIGAILKYLKCCAMTTFFDWKRKERKIVTTQEQIEHDHRPAYPYHGHTLEAEAIKKEQIQSIYSWLQREVSDHQEKLIIQLYFGQGSSPKQIVADCTEFVNSRDVYRVKERLLKRAKRALFQ